MCAVRDAVGDHAATTVQGPAYQDDKELWTIGRRIPARVIARRVSARREPSTCQLHKDMRLEDHRIANRGSLVACLKLGLTGFRPISTL